jgi:hypothetical protein
MIKSIDFQRQLSINQPLFKTTFGEMAEWLKAADCKSVHASVRRFESYSLHHFFYFYY